MSLLGSGSVHMANKYGKAKGQSSKQNAGTIRCQNCLQLGHWTYECRNERAYLARPSRTQQVENEQANKLNFLKASEIPEEIREGQQNRFLSRDARNKQSQKQQKKRKREDSSSSGSDSDSDSSSGSSDSDSGSDGDSDVDEETKNLIAKIKNQQKKFKPEIQGIKQEDQVKKEESEDDSGSSSSSSDDSSNSDSSSGSSSDNSSDDSSSTSSDREDMEDFDIEKLRGEIKNMSHGNSNLNSDIEQLLRARETQDAGLIKENGIKADISSGSDSSNDSSGSDDSKSGSGDSDSDSSEVDIRDIQQQIRELRKQNNNEEFQLQKQKQRVERHQQYLERQRQRKQQQEQRQIRDQQRREKESERRKQALEAEVEQLKQHRISRLEGRLGNKNEKQKESNKEKSKDMEQEQLQKEKKSRLEGRVGGTNEIAQDVKKVDNSSERYIPSENYEINSKEIQNDRYVPGQISADRYQPSNDYRAHSENSQSDTQSQEQLGKKVNNLKDIEINTTNKKFNNYQNYITQVASSAVLRKRLGSKVEKPKTNSFEQEELFDEDIDNDIEYKQYQEQYQRQQQQLQQQEKELEEQQQQQEQALRRKDKQQSQKQRYLDQEMAYLKRDGHPRLDGRIGQLKQKYSSKNQQSQLNRYQSLERDIDSEIEQEEQDYLRKDKELNSKKIELEKEIEQLKKERQSRLYNKIQIDNNVDNDSLHSKEVDKGKKQIVEEQVKQQKKENKASSKDRQQNKQFIKGTFMSKYKDKSSKDRYRPGEKELDKEEVNRAVLNGEITQGHEQSIQKDNIPSTQDRRYEQIGYQKSLELKKDRYLQSKQQEKQYLQRQKREQKQRQQQKPYKRKHRQQSSQEISLEESSDESDSSEDSERSSEITHQEQSKQYKSKKPKLLSKVTQPNI